MLNQTLSQISTITTWLGLIIIILLAISVMVFIHYERENTGKKIFLMLSMALCETLLFGLLMFILERTGLFWMRVVVYSNEFLITELAFAFYLFYLLVCFLNEFIRYIIAKINQKITQRYLYAVLLESSIQTIMILLLNYSFSQADFFGIYIYDFNGQPLWPFLFILFIFCLVFTSSLLIEYARRKFNIDMTI